MKLVSKTKLGRKIDRIMLDNVDTNYLFTNHGILCGAPGFISSKFKPKILY